MILGVNALLKALNFDKRKLIKIYFSACTKTDMADDRDMNEDLP